MATKPAATRKSPAPKPTEAPEPAPVEQTTPDGVLVVKTTDADGNIRVDVEPLGGVIATEVQTLIELGVGAWRQKIGLSG